MKITVTDQFGTELPQSENISAVLGQIVDSLDTLSGHLMLNVLDNPFAGVTLEEAAERLDVPKRSIRQRCQLGELHATRYPMRWRIPTSELDAIDGGDAK